MKATEGYVHSRALPRPIFGIRHHWTGAAIPRAARIAKPTPACAKSCKEAHVQRLRSLPDRVHADQPVTSRSQAALRLSNGRLARTVAPLRRISTTTLAAVCVGDAADTEGATLAFELQTFSVALDVFRVNSKRS